jgi:hypothetical protein
LIDAIRVMAGLVPMCAKLKDLHNAFSVMPGLVPGIHVVTGVAGAELQRFRRAAPDVILSDLH